MFAAAAAVVVYRSPLGMAGYGVMKILMMMKTAMVL